jgi:hypothetical protein
LDGSSFGPPQKCQKCDGQNAYDQDDERIHLGSPGVSGFDRGFNGSLLEQSKDRQCEERAEQKDQ